MNNFKNKFRLFERFEWAWCYRPWAKSDLTSFGFSFLSESLQRRLALRSCTRQTLNNPSVKCHFVQIHATQKLQKTWEKLEHEILAYISSYYDKLGTNTNELNWMEQIFTEWSFLLPEVKDFQGLR